MSAIEKHPFSSKTILISGAGLASLAFIRSLLLSWPSSHPAPKVTVYERDPRSLPPVRGNYSLGLRSDNGTFGLQALQNLGLIDEIVAHRAPEGGGAADGMMLRSVSTDREGKAGWEILGQKFEPACPPDGLPLSKMRITRASLRDVLLKGVEDAAAETGINVDVNWETYCTSASQTKDGRMEVRLNTDEIVKSDLLIVADGASSRLRTCLRPEDPLHYAGVTALYGHAIYPSSSTTPIELQEGSGVVLGGDGHGLIVFPLNEAGTFVWFLTRKEAEPREAIQGVDDSETQQKILREAREHGAVFGSAFESLLEATELASLKTFNARDKPPVKHDCIQEQPVVYIGDANHAMSPFSGAGANMAIMDGLLLGELLSRSASLVEAVQAFDKDSIPRCAQAIKRSRVVIFLMHSTGLVLWLATTLFKAVAWLKGWTWSGKR